MGKQRLPPLASHIGSVQMIGHGRSNPFQAWFLLPELVREKNPGNPIFFGGGFSNQGFLQIFRLKWIHWSSGTRAPIIFAFVSAMSNLENVGHKDFEAKWLDAGYANQQITSVPRNQCLFPWYIWVSFNISDRNKVKPSCWSWLYSLFSIVYWSLSAHSW